MEAPWLRDHSWRSSHVYVSQVFLLTAVALQEQLCLPRLCCCHSPGKAEFSADTLTLNCLCALVLMICGAVDLRQHKRARQESVPYTTVKMKWTDYFLFLLTDGCGHDEIPTLG